MKALLVSPRAYAAGAERVFATLAEALPDEGVEVCAALLAEGPLEDWLAAAGVDYRVVAAGRLRQVTRTGRTVAALSRLIGRERPGVLLSSQSGGHVYGGLAALSRGVPALWWTHSIAGVQPDALHRIARRIPVRETVCVSEACARAERRLRPGARTRVVHNGVPAAVASAWSGSGAGLRRERGWDGEVVIGLVARLDPWKRQDLFLRAAAELERDGRACRFVLIGGSEVGDVAAYEASLRGLTAELGLGDRVEFAGHVGGVYRWLDALDVVVNCSDGEPFGTVLLEGLALGKAIVATASGGTPEIVEDGVSGLLTTPGDHRALAAALGRVAGDAALRARLGVGARERAKRFTTGAMAAGFAACFRDTISQGRTT
jgi:glycosyltransferase involved in cell wall biosynthesis